MKYKIFDVNDGSFGHDKGSYEAKNPKEAIEKAGYKNIIRDYAGKQGNIVVQSFNKKFMSYVYFAERNN